LSRGTVYDRTKGLKIKNILPGNKQYYERDALGIENAKRKFTENQKPIKLPGTRMGPLVENSEAERIAISLTFKI
jgi:hypothetical protein